MKDAENEKATFITSPVYTHDGAKMSDAAATEHGAIPVDDFEENIQTYTAILLQTNRKKSTVQTNERYLRAAAKMVEGKDPLLWTEKDIQTFILSEKFGEWAPATARLCKAILKSYWEVHNLTAMLPPNNYAFWRTKKPPTDGTNRYDELKSKTPSRAEVANALKTCESAVLKSKDDEFVYRHFALFLTIAYGIRRAEVANLRLYDVQLDKETLHIEESKGDKSRDIYMDIPITTEMWDRFKAARSSIVERLISKASGAHLSTKLEGLLTDRAAPLFFCLKNGEVGDQAQPKAMGSMLKRLGSHTLGRDVNAHAWRHAKSFEVVKAMGIDQAAKYLGHSNIQQTYEYLHTGVAEQREAYQNGNPPAETTAPTAPAPTNGNDFEEKVRVLADLNKTGILTDSAFAAAIAALSTGNRNQGEG